MTIKISQLANLTVVQANTVIPVVSNITGTLTTVKGNVEQLKTFIIADTDANVLAANAATIFANTIMKAYVNGQITAANAGVISANLGLKGYVDEANLGMKGYVDSVASQSIYGNGNVKSYLTQFDSDIIPSANVTYSLGNVTHRWKDLYLSGNTIFLGDTTITTEGGKLVTTGAAISPPTGAVGFANVQYEETISFSTIYDYHKSVGHRYTANLTTYSSVPIVWDELRSVKLYVGSYAKSGTPTDVTALDNLGGRFANAVATLDATGNVSAITITDGGVGYDSYYPYYATDPIGYNSNKVGQSYNDLPRGAYLRRIGLIPTTASDVGNITSMSTLTRGASAPTVGSNTYTWTGNTGSTVSLTINWSSNSVSSYTYTPALPALTSAQDWQNWLLDYQSTNDYGELLTFNIEYYPPIYKYLNQEALPDSLTYDIANSVWYANGNFWDTPSANSFTVSFNRTAIGYAQLASSYGGPVYWSRGLSADTGISSGGDMTVAGDLRVTGDLYVSPTSIYMGNLRISAADGNLKVNTAIKFSDNSVQSSAYSNVQVATYLPTYSGNIGATTLNGNLTVYGVTNCGFPSQLSFPGVVLNATNDANSYVQLNIQNINSFGNLVSADFIATAPNGTDSSYYIDMGINGNNYSSSSWTVSGKNDGYVYINGGNLTLGTDTPGTTVKVHVGGTLAANTVATFTSNGVSVAGNVIVTATSGNIWAKYVRTTPSTVTGLGFANVAGAGTRAFVTDANTIIFNSVVSGGAGNSMPVFSDGTNWRIG